MFKGIQQMMHKLGPTAAPTDRSFFLPVLKSDVLLVTEKRKAVMAKLPSLLSLSDENFDGLCVNLLHRYAEFVQDLPETRNSYFANKGGMLDHALHRTQIALSLLHAYFLPSNSERTALTQPQTLWAYALFSAAVLYEIGRIVVDLEVDIYDRQKNLIKRWSPFEGSLLSQGHFYSYEFEKSRSDDFKQRATALLARQLMPREGFRWIASDKAVLEVWLALLDENRAGSGHFGILLSKADALAIKQYFDALKLAEQQGRYIQGKEASEVDFAAIAGGLDFLDWLRANLDDGTLNIDRDGIYKVEEGLLITDEAFKRYAETTDKHGNASVIRESFECLALHQVTAGGTSNQKFVQLSNNRRLSGLMVTQLDLMITDADSLRERAEAQKFLQHPANIALANRYIGQNGQLTSKVSEPRQTITTSSSR